MARPDNVMTIAATGTTVTAGASSTQVAVPNDASGFKARYVLVSCPKQGDYAFIKFGATGVVATTNDIGIGSTLSYVKFATQQFDFIGYIQGSTAPLINIMPVEP